MAPHARDPAFAEPAPHELTLRGVRARAFEFPGGSRRKSRAVVCIAGMGADGRSFARLAPLAQEWCLLPLNMPFDTPPGADPIAFAADVVEEFLDAEGLERPVILGSSFGGAVAATVTLRRHGNVGGLVLANAVLSRSQIPLAFPGFINFITPPRAITDLFAPFAVEIMGGLALDAAARDEIVREARHFTKDELQRRLRALMSMDLLPKVAPLGALPVLVVHGTRDWLVPWRRGLWTAEAIPRAQWELIEGAGHLPYLSHAHAFNSALASFLRVGVATHLERERT